MRLLTSLAALLVIALLWPAGASALQWSPPSADARLHFAGGTQPGAEWDTQGLGTGGQLSYNAGTQTLTITAVGDVMNYWDPNGGAATGVTGAPCTSETSSNCAFNFGPDLDITFSALFDAVVVTPLGGSFFNVQTNFKATGGVDLVVTDPSDLPAGSVLEANVQAGTFGGNPTTGLAASVVWDASLNLGLGGVVGGLTIVNGQAFLKADTATPYSSLFDAPGFFGLAFGTIQDFDDGAGGGLDEIVRVAVGTGALPSFTAEGNGQVFNLVAGSFVPEPGTLLLLGSGLAALAGLSRRRQAAGAR